MSAIHGVHIRIYNGTDLIGGQRNVTINTKSDTVEVHTKTDFPNKKYIKSWEDWDCSFDGVLQNSSLSGSIAAGDTVSVVIQDDSSTPGTSMLTGSAIVTEYNVEAGQDDITTFSVSLQGNGALTRTGSSSSSSQTQTPA